MVGQKVFTHFSISLAVTLSFRMSLCADTDPPKVRSSTVAPGHVEHTVDRSHIWLAQTPQCVRRDSLIAALAHASRTGFVGTDDVSLLEHAGIPVEVVVGDRLNLKITTPDDLVLAEAIAAVDDPR